MKPQHLKPYASANRPGRLRGCRAARGVNDLKACVVTILCDPRERPLSKVFNDDWVRENQPQDAPQPAVREVMDAGFPTDRLAPTLTRESPATLVQADGKHIGIVSRSDLLQQLIGTRS